MGGERVVGEMVEMEKVDVGRVGGGEEGLSVG